MEKKKRGLALVSPERRREIARMGGLAIKAIPGHLSRIGKKGGTSLSKDRAYMAEIGRKGGAAGRKGKGPKAKAQTEMAARYPDTDEQKKD